MTHISCAHCTERITTRYTKLKSKDGSEPLMLHKACVEDFTKAQMGVCAHCHGPIDGQHLRCQLPASEDAHKLHEECLETFKISLKRVCVQCQRLITDKFVQYTPLQANDEVTHSPVFLHETCLNIYKQFHNPPCNSCFRIIDEQCVKVGDDVFHVECKPDEPSRDMLSKRDCVFDLLFISIYTVPGVALRELLGISIGNRFCISTLIPNILGTCLFGFLTATQNVMTFSATGWSLGFCAALTSFSSWMMSAVSRPAEHAWLDIIGGTAISLIYFQIGLDTGHWVKRMFGQKEQTPSQPSSSQPPRLWEWIAALLCVVLSGVLLICLAVLWDDRGLLVAWSAPLGIPGALMRYSLRQIALALHKHKAYSTIASNVAACILVASLHAACASTAWCQYVSIGTGGALSTVSSWIGDSFALRRQSLPMNYANVLVTLVCGVIICGLAVWIP